MERILKLSIDLFEKREIHEKQVLVDSTVQEKNITYPTDTKLQKKIVEKCREIARDEGIALRQSYKRILRQLMIDQRFREHPKRRKKANAADLEMIEQVLINLIKNAIEAVKDSSEPKIKILADQNDNLPVIISVCDNGPRIPEENLDNIFIPFFLTKKEGSGIGLSLSRQIMKLHRERIDEETEAGAGTTFVLEF